MAIDGTSPQARPLFRKLALGMAVVLFLVAASFALAPVADLDSEQKRIGVVVSLFVGFVVSLDYRNAKEFDMIRALRSFQPYLLELDKRTLLSAGLLGHAAGRSPGAVMSMDTYRYYLDVVNGTGKALPAGTVMWKLVSKGPTPREGVIIDDGKIPVKLDEGKSALIETKKPSGNLSDRFTIMIGPRGKPSTDIPATSVRTGQPKPPLIATYTLPPEILTRRAC
jgi:hypothetical protein